MEILSETMVDVVGGIAVEDFVDIYSWIEVMSWFK